MKTEVVKGFKDFTGKDAVIRSEIQKVLVENFEKYGFEPAETPIVEYEEFVRGDNSDDEAVSSIFKLKDRGARNLALRYEFTFQLKRLMKDKKLPYKRYQIGPVFRDEPVTGNRFRQFTQCDVDVVGSSVKDEAEILTLVKRVLDQLKIDFIIYVNNRKLLNEILEKEGIEKDDWEKVIREIDKLDKLSEDEVLNNLKEYKAQKIIGIFKKSDSFFEKYETYSEIKELIKYCNYYNTQIKFLPSLARGLSYYNGSVFEVKTKKMKETITGGGSFLFNNMQSTGLSFGLDRLSLLAEIDIRNKQTMILSLSEDEQAIKLAEKLRNNGQDCFITYGKISKALDYANKLQILYVIILGENEIKEKKVKFKNMETGEERLLTISEVVNELKNES